MDQSRFTGNLRHYHRSGAQARRTWDDWVEGVSAKPRHSRKWQKIAGISLGTLALAGIVAGLVVELV